MCATIVDRVAAAALAWFNKMIPAKKHAANEHTVFSAIVVHESWDSDAVGGSEQFRVVSAGTGTKCVGVSGLCREGFVVADSHAETICRRSFLRYLYHELKHAPSDSIFDLPPPSSSSPRDDATPSHRRRHLKPSCQLYMYVSEAPCGDAALYDLTAASLEVIHEAKVKKQKVDHRCDSGDVVATVPCRTTGAKEAHSTAHSNVVGVARVKSGRSDILQANRTMSMSCSDKLCQWMVCGLQGALLSRWFDPIVLHGVVVSQPEDADPASFHDALRRCVSRGRNCATFPTSSHPFRLSKSPTRPSPSGLSLNWAAGCPDDSAVEYTIGARGVKMVLAKSMGKNAGLLIPREPRKLSTTLLPNKK
ncbi:hypothetical protein, variant [Aphanomyces invadans]|uniref:tRNA-specific adenosine deaminase 1 n=1 Tax=Aphanomyces invadans TaxID=157072 RepID=A0A024TNY7_9STRA|nr:hypothetical protein, variant [Aphanomyces invadans]ETV95733.1 hypothetical protein, variant [Aphanomyces invadans]|eukprot:XP_008875483.1 hypothetical protein, variant [Aphanomyces invadans]